MVSEIEKHISFVSENVKVLRHLRNDNLRMMLDIVSNWSEEFSRLRIRINNTENEKKIRTRKRVEKEGIRIGLIKDQKGG